MRRGCYVETLPYVIYQPFVDRRGLPRPRYLSLQSSCTRTAVTAVGNEFGVGFARR